MKQRKVPLRKCVVTQELFPKKHLIRVVRTPEGEVMIDPTGKQSGRGAYLSASVETIQLAQKRKSLERALKTSIPEALYEKLVEHVKRLELYG
ncbi:hypothetical protein SAMN05444392_11530 [Seinonella peptonophila]|uniref:YlxR domain-containing protein n=1 Tax=Seinonella peptonophila TaxID=112248 RepID=A0A1M5AQH8_9BACL|nr:YlxR family protein [Seinonella peptonophila]SHF32182.1 hypothetical protein SAMN05444392_11530 [Seinonella peptonophila]